MERTVFLTGANGYVGKATAMALRAAGWHVRALVRSAGTAPTGCKECVGDIRDSNSLMGAIRGCDAVVHLAATKADEPWSEDVNVRGTQNVWKAAETAGVKRGVYVSTQSARLMRPGAYGKTKRAGENVVRNSSVPSVILRPSLVYGDGASGVFGTLLKLARLPFIPMFGPGTAVFRPMHVDDLARTIGVALEKNVDGATFDIGGPDALTFDALIVEVLHRSNVRRPLVHIPRFVGYALAALPGSPITASNVRGGIERVEMNIAPMRELLGIEARAFRTDDTFERTLLRYVFSGIVPRWNPPTDVVVRMTAAMRAHGVPAAKLPPEFLLGPIDTVSRLLWPNGSLQRSLRVAAAIAETQPEGAESLLPPTLPIPVALSRCTVLGLRTMLLLCAGVLLLPLFPILRRHGT